MRIMHISRATLMVCQFLVPVMEAQKKKGHYVCVCGSDDSDVQKLIDIGIDVFPHKLKRNLNPFNIVKEIFRIKRILIEQKIDAVICHSPIGAGVGRIAARLAKTPNIIYLAHGFPCAPGQNIFLWLSWFFVEKILGYITDAILVMNSYDENLCKKHRMTNPENVLRIPGMGVDLGKFKTGITIDEKLQIQQELNIPHNATIVFCAAYLIPEKGIFVLLEAAKKICARRNDVYFLLAGTGPCIDELKSAQVLYAMQDHFKILGWRNDVDRLMRIADMFVLPTYYFEGLPVSILEAMACGKAVIATKHRGCADVVVDKKTGFLVPPQKTGPVVEKIELLVDSQHIREQMGREGRQRIEDYYELSHCTQLIVEKLEKLFHRKTC